MSTKSQSSKVIPRSTAFLVCDIQSRFREVIYEFEEMTNTAIKMVKVARTLEIPVVVTEQRPGALGTTVPEIPLDTLGDLLLGIYHKTLFSMCVPEVITALERDSIKAIVIFGIESHVCVLQSVLELLEKGYDVYVLADGISSCNKEEIPIAIARMRQAGAQITTSESVSFQLMSDAANPNFRTFSTIIKNDKGRTKAALQALTGTSLRSAL